MLILPLLTLLVGAVLLPADLTTRDQPKTIGYTLDLASGGSWILPRDHEGQPATKPPMVNWIGVVPVVVTGGASALTLRLPSLVAAVGIVGIVVWWMRSIGVCLPIALLAGTFWLCTPLGFDLSRRARPDMLDALWLTLAFVAATTITRGGSWRWTIVFWITVAASTLTKGPMALAAIGFGLSLPLITRRPQKLRPLLGLPLAMLPVTLWLLLAWRIDPDHVQSTLLDRELVGRITTAAPEGHVSPWWSTLLWFTSKNGPWIWLMLLAMIIGGSRVVRRRVAWHHPMVPVVTWLILALLVPTLSKGQRIDYVLPAMIPGSILAAWAVRHLAHSRIWLTPLVAAALLGYALLILYVTATAG